MQEINEFSFIDIHSSSCMHACMHASNNVQLLPVQVFSEKWITRARHIRISHHLSRRIFLLLNGQNIDILNLDIELALKIMGRWSLNYYQSEEGPQVTTLDLHPRLRRDGWGEELMAIANDLVGVVGDHHLRARLVRVDHFSDHPPNNQGLQHSCHG